MRKQTGPDLDRGDMNPQHQGRVFPSHSRLRQTDQASLPSRWLRREARVSTGEETTFEIAVRLRQVQGACRALFYVFFGHPTFKASRGATPQPATLLKLHEQLFPFAYSQFRCVVVSQKYTGVSFNPHVILRHPSFCSVLVGAPQPFGPLIFVPLRIQLVVRVKIESVPGSEDERIRIS